MSGKGKKGPVKPKGPTTEELKAEIEDLNMRLRLCAATNTLLRRDKAGDQTKVYNEEYGGDQIYKDGYNNVTAELKRLESQGTGSNPSSQGQDTKEIEDLKTIIAAKDKENTDLKNTVAKHGQQIIGLQQQLNGAKRELEETQKKLKEEAKRAFLTMSEYRKTDKDLRGEDEVSSGANVKFTGITKPKGPTSEELKAENENLKKRLRLCAATNTL